VASDNKPAALMLNEEIPVQVSDTTEAK